MNGATVEALERSRVAGAAPSPTERFEAAFAQHADFVFRSCRRFGLDEGHAEDAVQQAFLVLARRIDEVPVGKERAYLYGVASNVASNVRRGMRRRREELGDKEERDLAPLPDAALDLARARATADRILEDMDADLRAAFVLFEIEEMTFSEMAEALAIPRGTVASRVRRAREEFETRVRRLKKGANR